MAKYIIFQNNEFYRLASNEAKRDKWLVSPNIIAKEVNDADYRKVWCKMSTVTDRDWETHYFEKLCI